MLPYLELSSSFLRKVKFKIKKINEACRYLSSYLSKAVYILLIPSIKSVSSKRVILYNFVLITIIIMYLGIWEYKMMIHTEVIYQDWVISVSHSSCASLNFYVSSNSKNPFTIFHPLTFAPLHSFHSSSFLIP